MIFWANHTLLCCAGLWKRRCLAEETRFGIAMLQHGLLTRAQDTFLEAQSKATGGSYSTANAGISFEL